MSIDIQLSRPLLPFGLPPLARGGRLGKNLHHIPSPRLVGLGPTPVKSALTPSTSSQYILVGGSDT